MRLYPATVALPAVGWYKPVSTDIRVVFPAPWYTSKQTNKNNQQAVIRPPGIRSGQVRQISL